MLLGRGHSGAADTPAAGGAAGSPSLAENPEEPGGIMTPTSPQDKGRPSAKLEVVRQYRGGVLHRELLLGHSQGARTASVSGNGNQQQWPSGLDLAGALLAPFLPKGFPDSVSRLLLAIHR